MTPHEPTSKNSRRVAIAAAAILGLTSGSAVWADGPDILDNVGFLACTRSALSEASPPVAVAKDLDRGKTFVARLDLSNIEKASLDGQRVAEQIAGGEWTFVGKVAAMPPGLNGEPGATILIAQRVLRSTTVEERLVVCGQPSHR